MRKALIDKVISDANYKKICQRINYQYADDIYQEVCCELLTMDESRLPELSYLNFWFYRVSLNVISRHGQLGKYIHRKEQLTLTSGSDELTKEQLMKEAERFMLSLSEFENRIILLYNQYGSMKEVQRITGVSYSALRSVKELIKQKAKEINV